MQTILTFSKSGENVTPRLQYHNSVGGFVLPNGQVRLRTLASPINPIDLLVLAGRYPVKPKNVFEKESILGYDGVFQVIQSHDPSLAEGDYVIPREHGFGTWRTHATTEVTDLLKIPRMDPRAAAILKMGACPAYLLLEDMVSLERGDWIIQNGGTSVIAQLVIQYARLRGVHTATVIRDRPDFDAVKSRLEKLGADIVVSESDFQGECAALKAKRFVLGLDCVFGASGEAIAKILAPNSTYVNFGLLGGGTISITSEMIFFKALTFRSFRLSKSLASRSEQQVEALLVKLATIFATGQVQLPELDVVHWSNVDDVEGVKELEERLVAAVDRARSAEMGKKKVILSFL